MFLSSAAQRERAGLVSRKQHCKILQGTIMVIAHRLSTIKDADRIIVLHEGALLSPTATICM